jgi:hypothetical protein
MLCNWHLCGVVLLACSALYQHKRLFVQPTELYNLVDVPLQNMRQSTQDYTARMFSPEFDCELPEDVRAELVQPQRPRILTQPPSPPPKRSDYVCTPGYAQAHRPSFAESNALKHEVFARYGIAWNEHGKYELDHLVPLELGGNSSIENLWPELWPDAIAKDALENRLHALVCAGELSLHDAQIQISSDWESCYRRYLGNP